MAKVVFVQQGAVEWLGTMYVSAMLRARGHSTSIFVGTLEKQLCADVLNTKPDVVAFSCLTTDYDWALRQAAEIRKKFRGPIIFGGTHVTLNAADTIAQPAVDAVCVGEGEYPMTEYVDAVSAGGDGSGVANMWVKKDGDIVRNPLRDLIEDLDSLPCPDRDLYARYSYFQKRGVRPLHIGRGCPYLCTYCHNAGKKELYEGKGPYVRWRSAESVLAEIDEIERKGHVRTLHFIDDGFGMNREWTVSFLGRLCTRPRRHVLHLNMRADMVTPDLCRALREYGPRLLRLRIAVECGDETYRRDVLRKRLTTESLIRAAEEFHRHGLPFSTYNMVGLPGETYEQGLETLRLNLRLRPASTFCFVFQPYPGTELADYAVRNGYLSEEHLKLVGTAEYSGWFHSKSLLRQPDIEKLQNLQRVFSIVTRHPFLYPLAERMARSHAASPLLALGLKLDTRWTRLKRRFAAGF